MFEVFLYFWYCFKSAFSFLLTLAYILNGDIELNPGQIKLKTNYFSVCQWNLNSLSGHNFSKLTQLKAYNSVYKNNFICLPETYLDTSIPNNLSDIEGYKILRADHPDNIKRGGVCSYYKEALPVRLIGLPYFKGALLLEMSENNKK